MSEKLKKEVAELKTKVEALEADLLAKDEVIAELEEKLSQALKTKAAPKGSHVIMDKKDLKEGKQYVTGPSGVGFVEA